MSVQITTNSSDEIDVTVWREDDGRYIVETRRWIDANANIDDNDGDFPIPDSVEWSPYFLTEREACTYAGSEL
jgi:hypothetical protein